MFVKTGENTYKVIGESSKDIIPSLADGLYRLNVNVSFFGTSITTSEIDRYKGDCNMSVGVFKEATDHIDKFFDEKMYKVRKELGMLDKTSLLFHGLPGTGKTHLACNIAKYVATKYNGIGVVLNTIEDVDFPTLVDKLRVNDAKDRMIIFVLDELEKSGKRELKSPKFLEFLDGAGSRDNVIIIATANDISEFPDFLVNRPGRFEKIFAFDLQNRDILCGTLEGMLPKTYSDIEGVKDAIMDNAIHKGVKTLDELRFVIRDVLFEFETKGSLPIKEVVEKTEPIVEKSIEVKPSKPSHSDKVNEMRKVLQSSGLPEEAIEELIGYFEFELEENA